MVLDKLAITNFGYLQSIYCSFQFNNSIFLLGFQMGDSIKNDNGCYLVVAPILVDITSEEPTMYLINSSPDINNFPTREEMLNGNINGYFYYWDFYLEDENEYLNYLPTDVFYFNTSSFEPEPMDYIYLDTTFIFDVYNERFIDFNNNLYFYFTEDFPTNINPYNLDVAIELGYYEETITIPAIISSTIFSMGSFVLNYLVNGFTFLFFSNGNLTMLGIVLISILGINLLMSLSFLIFYFIKKKR